VVGESENVGWVMKSLPYIITILLMLLHALRLPTHNQTIGSPDPLFFVPPKLIGADHGLHTPGGVQFTCL
jgi:hypothetical protein